MRDALTAQEIFDTVARHLLTRRKQSAAIPLELRGLTRALQVVHDSGAATWPAQLNTIAELTEYARILKECDE